MNPKTSRIHRALNIGLVVAALCLSNRAEAQDWMAQGDAAWARRAEGAKLGLSASAAASQSRAASGPIDQALAAYEKAIQAEPARLEGYWKLLRAIHFKGEFVATSTAAKQETFGRGREVSDKALALLAKKVGGMEKLEKLEAKALAKALASVPEAPHVYLWAAVDWGLWGDAFGKIAAARQGVGDRLRRYGEVVLAFDERFEEGGAHRMLGRLHTLAPKIPLVTGWVDRKLAVFHLRRSIQIAPRNPYNQLYLAEALLEFEPAAKNEAIAILKRLATQTPSVDQSVEDAAPIAVAKTTLSKLGS
jgi:tetratricopeptide (TPR) repeat protein